MSHDIITTRKHDLASFDEKNALLGLRIQSMNGRYVIDADGKNLIDFSTQCYLGFDVHKDIIHAQMQGVEEFGNVVPWSRSVAIFDIYFEAEKALAELVGAEATNLFLSTTLLNHGVISTLAGHPDALIAFEKSAHMTCFEGALIAKSKGAKLLKWDKIETLEGILSRSDKSLKLIVTDGVQSMSGTYADLPKLNEIAIKYNALVYVDDAHGFGVIGENPTPEFPYGKKGNGLVRYFDLNYDRILYVGCLSKAYGLSGAFIACSKAMKQFLLLHAPPHDLGLSGQASVIRGLLKALDVNRKDGDSIRHEVYENVAFLREKCNELGFKQYKPSSTFPIVTLMIEDDETYLHLCRRLYEGGILVTPEPFAEEHHQENGERQFEISQKKPKVHLLRFTITYGIKKKDLEQLISILGNFQSDLKK